MGSVSRELDLDAIEARANAATPGPWTTGEHPLNDATVYSSEHETLIYDEGGHTPEDARFIAHARTDIPALIAEIRRLRALTTSSPGGGETE